MKVIKRILIKSIILVLVIAAGSGTAIGVRGYRQSTAQYAVDTYTAMLTEGNGEKAFDFLEQAAEQVLTKEEYLSVLEAEKYGLYSAVNIKEAEKHLDSDGNEYTDYHVEFLDASGAVQKEEDFTAKKHAAAVFGIFDEWKILSDHCMIENFGLTVPVGAEVYIDNKQADSAWIAEDGEQQSFDTYRIPSMIPGKYSLVVRHPAFESVNATLDTANGDADYTGMMTLKSSAQDSCKELGVKALKLLYTSAAAEKQDELKELFADCLSDAKKLSKNQAKEFHKEDTAFKQAAVSGFAAQFGEPQYTGDENGAITTEMTFSYHYAVREEKTVDTGEYYEDGSTIMETVEEDHSGDATAKFVMSYYDGVWRIASFDIPVIPEAR